MNKTKNKLIEEIQFKKQKHRKRFWKIDCSDTVNGYEVVVVVAVLSMETIHCCQDTMAKMQLGR